MAKLGKDVWILGLLLVLVIILGIVLGNHQSADQGPEVIPVRTTYSARPGGLRALYETLESLGYPVKRNLGKFDTEPEDGVLFVVAPEAPISREEWDTLRRWIERGNLLVLTGNAVAEPSVFGGMQTVSSTPACPSFLSRGVSSFVVAEEERIERPYARLGARQRFTRFGDFGRRPSQDRPAWQEESAPERPLVPLFADHKGTIVGFSRWGRGAVISLPGGWALSNQGISQADNLTLVINAVNGAGRGARITFDEYHHGYGAQQGITSLLSTPAWLGLGVIGIGFLLLVVNGSCRFGRPIPLVEGARQRGEYLSSMSSLVRKARATDLVVSELGGRFLTDAAIALGVPPGSSTEVIMQAASKRRVEKLSELRELCDAAQGALDYTEAQVFALVKRMYTMRKDLRK